MKHYRTINQLHKELLEDDPYCALTKTALRKFVISGEIPSKKAGKKYIISREDVEDFLDST